MADSMQREPLDATQLISETLSLFFRRFFLFFTIAFVPTLLLGLVSLAIVGDLETIAQEAALNTNPNDPFAFMSQIFTPAYFVLMAFSVFVYFVISAVITLAAYDAASGRPANISGYISQTMRHIFPLIVLGLLITVFFIIGSAFLIVPGLYIAARFWVLAPAILIDKTGWGSLGRASTLSKEYRWPIVGVSVVMFLIIFGISLVLGLFLGILRLATFFLGGFGLIVTTALNAVVNAVTYGIFGVFTAQLYARLLAIKEGVVIEDIETVFE